MQRLVTAPRSHRTATKGLKTWARPRLLRLRRRLRQALRRGFLYGLLHTLERRAFLLQLVQFMPQILLQTIALCDFLISQLASMESVVSLELKLCNLIPHIRNQPLIHRLRLCIRGDGSIYDLLEKELSENDMQFMHVHVSRAMIDCFLAFCKH
jgi:hypothetical protein